MTVFIALPTNCLNTPALRFWRIEGAGAAIHPRDFGQVQVLQ